MAAQGRGRIIGRLILIRDITRRKTAEAEKERLYTDLKASMEQTRKLQGLLPICPDCMKTLYPDYTKSGSKGPGDKERK